MKTRDEKRDQRAADERRTRLRVADEVTRGQIMKLMRDALDRLADAEAAKAQWFQGRDEERYYDDGRTASTSAIDHRWATRPKAKAIVSENQWQMSQSTMYAVNALVMLTDTIVQQNATIITLLDEMARAAHDERHAST